jgi:N-acetylmuramoyl-L-alanine amidase
MASPAWAEQPLSVVYPPADHQTTAERIFFIGTAPPAGEVFVNGKEIARSRAGHFAPSFPLKLGDNLFTLRYQNQQVQIQVKRLLTAPSPPIGLAFGKDSLTPTVDIARLPGELICFSAIAPRNATVSAQVANQTIPLVPQSEQVELPANSAALTGQNQPSSQSVAGQYQGCATISFAPADLGQPKFQLTLNGKTTTQVGSGKISVLSPTQLEVAEVTADSGVARTGPSTDYSRLTPLPKGTRATVTGREGEWLRLDYGGWINSKETRILKSAVPPRSLIRSIRARQVPGATEVVFPLQVPVPVSVQQGGRTLTLSLYNTTAQTDVIRLDDDPAISRLDWQQIAPGQVQYTFNLKTQQQWGYKLRYDGTSLVLTLRHPPGEQRSSKAAEQRSKVLFSNSSPLSGVKILLDPGHGGSELGSRGPTGYPEKDINLVISKLVREQLLARGATVYITRDVDKEVSLPDRVAMIDKLEPAIAVSLHYNALPDSGDAINTKGFAAFWYHPQAHNLAVFLHNYVVNKLRRPSYGVYWNNLALTRPATAPSVLLELGFMINPTEFEWIVNAQEQRKLAVAIADGITEWFEIAR